MELNLSAFNKYPAHIDTSLFVVSQIIVLLDDLLAHCRVDLPSPIFTEVPKQLFANVDLLKKHTPQDVASNPLLEPQIIQRFVVTPRNMFSRLIVFFAFSDIILTIPTSLLDLFNDCPRSLLITIKSLIVVYSLEIPSQSQVLKSLLCTVLDERECRYRFEILGQQ